MLASGGPKNRQRGAELCQATGKLAA